MALSHCLFKTDFGWMILQKDETGLIKSTIPVESRDMCIKKISESKKTSVLDNHDFKYLIERIQTYLSGSSDDFKDISVSMIYRIIVKYGKMVKILIKICLQSLC